MRVFFVSEVDFEELGTASGVFSGCVPRVSFLNSHTGKLTTKQRAVNEVTNQFSNDVTCQRSSKCSFKENQLQAQVGYVKEKKTTRHW